MTTDAHNPSSFLSTLVTRTPSSFSDFQLRQPETVSRRRRVAADGRVRRGQGPTKASQDPNFRLHGATIWPLYLASVVKPDLAIRLKRE